MRKKIILLILGTFILVILFTLGYLFLQPYYQIWKIASQHEKLKKELIEYFKKDIHGGRTPKETYNLYLATLKKGNLEEASQYYWWTTQEKEKERLKRLKQENKLQEYIESFPEWEEMEEEEGDEEERRYSYKYIQKENEIIYDILLKQERTIPAGEYKGSITFRLNKYANIWKIY